MKTFFCLAIFATLVGAFGDPPRPTTLAGSIEFEHVVTPIESGGWNGNSRFSAEDVVLKLSQDDPRYFATSGSWQFSGTFSNTSASTTRSDTGAGSAPIVYRNRIPTSDMYWNGYYAGHNGYYKSPIERPVSLVWNTGAPTFKLFIAHEFDYLTEAVTGNSSGRWWMEHLADGTVKIENNEWVFTIDDTKVGAHFGGSTSTLKVAGEFKRPLGEIFLNWPAELVLKSAQMFFQGTVECPSGVKNLSRKIMWKGQTLPGSEADFSGVSGEGQLTWEFDYLFAKKYVSQRFDDHPSAREFVLEITAESNDEETTVAQFVLQQDSMSFAEALGGSTHEGRGFPDVPYANLAYNRGSIDSLNRVKLNGGVPAKKRWAGIDCTGFVTLILQRMLYGDAWIAPAKPENNFYKNSVGNGFGHQNAKEFGLGPEVALFPGQKISEPLLANGGFSKELLRLVALGALVPGKRYMFSVKEGTKGHVGFVVINPGSVDGNCPSHNFSNRKGMPPRGGLDTADFSVWLADCVGPRKKGKRYQKPKISFFEVPNLPFVQ